MDPVNVTAKFEVRSFTRLWDNSGYLNILGIIMQFYAVYHITVNKDFIRT